MPAYWNPSGIGRDSNGLQALEPLALAADVALVAHAAFEDAALLAVEPGERGRLDAFEPLNG